MNGKVIFVLVDALGYDAATKHCGFLEHLAEAGQAAKYKMRGELPSMSRPMYTTLLTGLPVWKHGIVSNRTVKRCEFMNLFSITKEAGLCNAVAGYGWLSELFTDRPGTFDVDRDRFQFEPSGDAMHGISYIQDEYPDPHLFADAEYLRCQFRPDFLMIHPMGVDEAGHKAGADSQLYAHFSAMNSDLVATHFDDWISDGYQLVVTGDHGMDLLGMHGGNEAIQREVPLYIVSPMVKNGDFTDAAPDKAPTTLDIAPLLLRLLGLAPASGMICTDHIALA